MNPVVMNEIYKGCTIPEGYVVETNPNQDEVTVYDTHHHLYAHLSIVDGKLQGVSEFYENGVLKEKRTYMRDVAEGWGCEYENGVESQWFRYENGIRVSKIGNEDSTGFREEVSLSSGERMSIFQYGADHHRLGGGFVFEKGFLQKEVVFENGVEKQLLREFKEKNMKEYDSDKHVVYDGEYLNDLKLKFPREGNGKSYYHGKMIYEGQWKTGQPTGQGKVFDSEGNILHEGTFNQGSL